MATQSATERNAEIDGDIIRINMKTDEHIKVVDEVLKLRKHRPEYLGQFYR